MDNTHMDDANTQESMEENISSSAKDMSSQVNITMKKSKLVYIIIAGVIVLILVGLFFAKSLFVAATVNGSPISRFSVISELEKQSGAQVLGAIIDQKLIKAELDNQGVSVAEEEIDAEIKKIEEQIASQGGELSQILAAQGVTETELREQISIQKRLEKILADKIVVSDEEVNAYITDNAITLPEGMTMEVFVGQIKEQLKNQKFQQEAGQWVSDVTASADIKYYIEY
ncbi:MAG: hypothetical protein COU90_03055 [Candidatus Ryanbacteria bacterium CG10_big_fil_rev_8_21_14_0_10_43_42]|uniref:PpiC domain-containing protein n=1 Tax=Candidatus Ryanbacteria bacterium CG10_big_fil_rev_8_21_14_0_10_43_42 TaxID=1974864 RepID=A0A2M8KWV6_9BACT|nr:MAG: hypothetical protein COU90_03055 [Candidatus Ryanbacteria bacterium CG10_big_fil_rev_8_21_14_0_10_43_42]